MAQATKQVRVVTATEAVAGQDFEPTAFFDADGNPVDIGGGGGAPAWADVTGKPTTFAPAAHKHPIADVTGLQAALDAKPDTDTNTTYPALTAAQVTAGTATTASSISAKVLADEIDRRVAAAIAAIPAG